MRGLARLAALCGMCLGALGAFSQSEPDLDRIPPAITAQSEEYRPAHGSSYWQTDLTFTAARNDLLVPLSPPPSWEARSFFDLRQDLRLSDAFSVVYSGRLNARVENGGSFPGRENFRSDLREAYVAWTDNRGWFLQFGRINLKSGVAEGFNPTDYFKTRAVVEPTSIDPAVLREGRLGVVMLQSQWIGASGSLTLAVAPKLADDSPPYDGNALPPLNPMLDRTNSSWQALFKASFAASNGISPEFMIDEDSGSTRFGFNVSKGIGKSIVAYLEWSGGRRASLAEEAYLDGRRTEILPGGPAIPSDQGKTFSHDLAVGVSYTTQGGINLAAEFDYHQAGFSGSDWLNWFGTGKGASAALNGELWFIRGYAAEQQEPIAQKSLFFRAYWQDAFVKNLTLSAFALGDLHDGSTLAQLSTDYFLSPRWTVGAILDAYRGIRQSDFGSLPQRGSALLKVTRYF